MAISTIDLGKIKWIWRGAWTTATPYTADDVVSYAGSTYICVSAHTSAGAFSSDLATRWNIIAEGGTPTTTLGDVIVRGASQDERLALGSEGQVLTSYNGNVAWETPNLATNVYYVSEDGDDANDGRSLNTPWASVAYACTQMTGPATLYVKSGVYTETLPITVPAFVAVLGDSMRTTTITAAAGSQSSTMWKLGNGAILNKMLFTGLTGFVLAGDNITNATLGGVYVALDSTSPITSKSPYVIECSAISSGGVGAVVDGSLHATGNKSIVFHGYTVILDNGAGIWVKDGAKAEIVSCFTYFCHFGYAATGGGKIRSLNGNNSYGTYGAVSRGFNNAEVTLDGALYGTQVAFTSLTGGSFSVGNTVTGVSSSTVATVTNVQNTKVYINITSGTGFTDGETIGNGSGVTATVAASGASGQKGFVLVADGLASEPVPGGSIEIAGDAFTYVIQNVSGTYVDTTSVITIVLAGEKVAASADNATFKIRYDFSQIRLTGHDFLSIGTGGVTTTNYPGVPTNPPAQGNEVVESFPGRVFYVSTDQDGNFRGGDYFRVDQATGRATLNANAFDLAGLTSLRLGSIGAQLGELVNEFSSDPTLSGNSNAAVPTEAAVKGYFTQVDQNIVPDTDDTHTLGTPSNRWNHVYVGPGSITLGSLTITDADGALDIKVGETTAGAKINAISNGTSNVSVALNGDITLTAAGVLAATLTDTSTTVAGNLIVSGTLYGPSTFTIDPAGYDDNTGTVVIAGNLQVDGTTTTINSTTMTVDDKNIVLGSGAANDAAADGAGITIESGDGNKTWNWVNSTDAWTSSEHIDFASGKKIKIAGSAGTDNKFLQTTSSGMQWADAAVTVTDITTNSTYYPLFTTATSGTVTTASVTSTKFSFNPNSGKLTVPNMIVGDNTTSTGALVVGSANSFAGGLVLGKPSTYSGYISATDNLYMRAYASGGTGNGSVVIENVTGTPQFTMNSSTGVLTTTGGFVESSSITLKENVNPITNALDAIMSLVGVTYDRKNGSSKNEAGLIAEDVDRVLPNLVSHSADGHAEGIYYSKLTAYLVEAIKSLKAEIDPLKEEIKKLKGE